MLSCQRARGADDLDDKYFEHIKSITGVRLCVCWNGISVVFFSLSSLYGYSISFLFFCYLFVCLWGDTVIASSVCPFLCIVWSNGLALVIRVNSLSSLCSVEIISLSNQVFAFHYGCNSITVKIHHSMDCAQRVEKKREVESILISLSSVHSLWDSVSVCAISSVSYAFLLFLALAALRAHSKYCLTSLLYLIFSACNRCIFCKPHIKTEIGYHRRMERTTSNHSKLQFYIIVLLLCCDFFFGLWT